MRNFIAITLFLSCIYISFAQEKYIIVNNDSISVSDFKEFYGENIKYEGLDNAINSYTNFKLMSQISLKNKVDTTAYYKSNLESFLKKEINKYLDYNGIKDELSKEIYDHLQTEKKVSVYYLAHSNPFNQEAISLTKSDINKLHSDICNKNDTISLKDFKEKINSTPFWYKPLSAPYSVERSIFSTKLNKCSSIEHDQFGSFFVKVLEENKAKKLPSYKQIKDNLIESISHNAFYDEILTKELNKNLIKITKFEEDKSVLLKTRETAKTLFKNSNNQNSLENNQIIWNTAYSSFTQDDLLKQLHEIKSPLDSSIDFDRLLDYYVPKIKNQFIYGSYLKNIMDYQPELKKQYNLMSETLLVNHFIETEIYNKAEHDSIGKMNFMKQHQSTYTWPKRYDLIIYRYYNQNIEKELMKWIADGKTSDEILKHFNHDAKPIVVATHGKLSYDHSNLPENFDPTKKIQKNKYLTQNAIFVLKDIIPPTPMTIKEAGNTLEDSYKSQYFNTTLEKLRNNANLMIPTNID